MLSATPRATPVDLWTNFVSKGKNNRFVHTVQRDDKSQRSGLVRQAAAYGIPTAVGHTVAGIKVRTSPVTRSHCSLFLPVTSGGLFRYVTLTRTLVRRF
jgi:hypothetical protein